MTEIAIKQYKESTVPTATLCGRITSVLESCSMSIDSAKRSPISIGITTLPSRILKIRPCLESLLAGSVVPDKIFLALPAFSRREKSPYSVPEFLRDHSFCRSIVEVVEADRDWGPGTKLLGALDFVPANSYLVLADDDVRYRPEFLANLMAAQVLNHRASFSHYTYRAEGLTIGQGCDGFSFWTPNLAGIRSFAEAHIAETDLFFHDDLWISFFLASRGVAIRSLAHVSGARLIYESEHETNSLRHLSGDLAREQLNREGVKYLLSKVQINKRARCSIFLAAKYDKLLHFLMRASRFLARIIAPA